MLKDVNNKSVKFGFIIKGVFTFLITTILAMTIFAIASYFIGIDTKYSPIFGTVSVAAGIFVTSFIISKKIGKKGYLTGFIIAFCIFLINLIISLVADDGAVTINTLFHLIIYLLSGLIGGVMGVNKKTNTTYI